MINLSELPQPDAAFFTALAVFDTPIASKQIPLVLHLWNALDISLPMLTHHTEADFQRLLSTAVGDALVDKLADGSWQLRGKAQMAVLLQLQQRGDLKAAINAHRRVMQDFGVTRDRHLRDPDFCRREAMHFALLGDHNASQQWSLRFRQCAKMQDVAPGSTWLACEDGRRLFATLLPTLQEHFLIDNVYLGWMGLRESKDGYRYALQFITQSAAGPEHTELLENLAWYALQAGEISDLEKVLARLNATTLTPFPAMLACMCGDYAMACTAFENFIKVMREHSGKRNAPLLGVPGLMYCVALLGKRDAASMKRLQTHVKSAMQYGSGHEFIHMESMLHHLQHGTPYMDTTHLRGNCERADFLYIALAMHWGNSTDQVQSELQTLRSKALAAGFSWIAAEADALLAQMYGVARVLPDWYAAGQAGQQFRPLVKAMVSQEGWQRALDALKQLRGAARVEGDSRLVWLLEEYGDETFVLSPIEQKKNAKGVWGKGRPIALKRLAEGGDDLPRLLPQDQQALKFIMTTHDGYRGYANYEFDSMKALPHLVGHPHVFWRDAPDVKLELVRGEFALQLQQRAGQIAMQLQPALPRYSDVLLHKETPTKLVLFIVSAELRQIATIVGKGLLVPDSAKPQLVEAIAAIAPHLAIHSDLPEMAAHVENVTADGTLYVHLLPWQEGLRVQCLVRPLAQGSWCVPAKGTQHVLGQQGDKTVQATRDFAQEQQSLQTVLEACPALNLAEYEADGWRLHSPLESLELVSQLAEVQRAGTDQGSERTAVQVIWPEGERFRVKGIRSAQDMRLQIKRQGDWFALSGEVSLDDGRVLALKELLALANTGEGRFIKVGEQEFLALSESLRKRLAELQVYAERTAKEGLRFNPLAAGAVAEFASEVGDLQADKAWRAQVEKLDALAEYMPVLPSTLQAELRDYQLQGFQWLARLAQWGVGACLADDMGLGKTLQALALLLLRASSGPALVVAPISVALNWQSETARFAPTLKVRAYHQDRSLADLGPFDIVIVSYNMLQIDSEAFAAQHWHSVVLDEAQVIKNAATKRSQAAMALQADFKMIASGTPMENHLGELWNLFRFINPGLLGSKESFAERFATPIERGDVGARQHLKKLIQPFILRRTKAQVLSELPARTEITLRVALSDEERHLYEALRQQALENIANMDDKQNKALHVLTEITKLRRFCCHPQLAMPGSAAQAVAGSKLAVFAEVVEELLENRHKALVFSQFTDHLAIVRAWLDEKNIRYQYLDGSTPPVERQKRVAAFQNGEGDVFLISLKAGGTGLNLTAADYVLHLDPWWNPAVEDQASDRAHRMGQQRPVTVYRLVTEGTIEEKIIALHSAKRDLADSLLEGGDAAGKLDTSALLRLLKENSVEQN